MKSLTMPATVICALLQVACPNHHSTPASEVVPVNPSETSKTGGTAAPTPAFLPWSPAKSLGEEFNISCDGACPESVGVLFISNDSEKGYCTVFLAGESNGHSLVATSKHCVEAVHDCSRDLFFRFPSSHEAAVCARITDVSPFELNDSKGKLRMVPDYAVIELDRKISRPALLLTQAGLPFQTPISVEYADKAGSRAIVMRTTKCTTTNGPTVLNPTYQGAQGPTVNLFKCDFKGGVSGSPIFNAHGEVAGMAQIGAKDGIGAGSLSVDGVDSSAFNVKNAGIATNLACARSVELGLTQPAPASICEADEGGAAKRVDELMMHGFNKAELLRMVFKGFARFVRSDTTGIFGWKLDATTKVNKFARMDANPFMMFEIVPACVLRPEDQDSKLKQFEIPSFVFFTAWANEGRVDIQSPAWYSALQIGEQGEVKIQLGESGKDVTYKFKPKEIANLGVNKTEAQEISSKDWVQTPFNLSYCEANWRSSNEKSFAEMEHLANSGTDQDILGAMDKK